MKTLNDEDTLNEISFLHDQHGPRVAYRYFFNLRHDAAIDTNSVEDFIIQFYSTFNSTFYPKY